MSRSILIMNCEDGDRQLLGVYSEMLGYEPVMEGSLDGCDVLHPGNKKCEREQPCSEVLLVDREMSTMPGLDIVDIQIRKGCKIPVSCKTITAGKMSGDEFKRAKKLGCHVLQKPVTFEILENWLSQVEKE